MKISPENLRQRVTKEYDFEKVCAEIDGLDSDEKSFLLEAVNGILERERAGTAKKSTIWTLLETVSNATGMLGLNQLTESMSESKVVLRLQDIKDYLER